jgi:hypothetical protein
MDPLHVCIAVTALMFLIFPVRRHLWPRPVPFSREMLASLHETGETAWTRPVCDTTSPSPSPPAPLAKDPVPPAPQAPAHMPPEPPPPGRPPISVIVRQDDRTTPKPGAKTLRGRIASLEGILTHGAFPPGIALSVTFEIARAKRLLGEDGHHLDDDGNPLRNPFASEDALQCARLAVATAEAVIKRPRP